MENTIIDKNWKSLIKPNRLNIKSNLDKSVATVVAEPLEKDMHLQLEILLEEFYFRQFKDRPLRRFKLMVCCMNFHQLKE